MFCYRRSVILTTGSPLHQRIFASLLSIAIVAVLATTAQAQTTQTCTPGAALILEGNAPAQASLVARFNARPVGGGLSDQSGHYRITLTIGQERPGTYPVSVEIRDSREIVQRLSCTVPGATSRPASTATSGPGSAPTVRPTTVSAAPTTAPTVRPTATPDLSVLPAETECGTITREMVLEAPNSPVRIAAIDKGNETVTLENVTDQAVDLTGWRVCSVYAASEPGQEHNGISGTLGSRARATFDRPQSDNIWNNEIRDDGALFDPAGTLMSYWVDK